jgi:hypothetical protein
MLTGQGTVYVKETVKVTTKITPQITKTEQAWLSSPGWDCTWIIAPAFLSTALIFALRGQISESENVPLWVWVCFVLLIDVAHVYATLFRTYLNSTAFSKHKNILIAMPLVAWIGGSLLYSLDAIFFWRALAYLAVFHFIRQQFGFVALYSRKDPPISQKFSWLDKAAVYAATLYPILFWHTHMPRHFSWFVAGDFIESIPQALSHSALAIYVLIAAAYIGKETLVATRQKYLNIPRNLLVAGTALSWWTGIITFNSDMAFTITNVVSHGIPYMALIWLYHNQQKEAAPLTVPDKNKWRRLVLSNVMVFFLFLALLAYLEEGIWDGLIWREHLSFFTPFMWLPTINDGAVLALLIPFLALPQSTHYLLDGYIWRVKDKTSVWSA